MLQIYFESDLILEYPAIFEEKISEFFQDEECVTLAKGAISKLATNKISIEDSEATTLASWDSDRKTILLNLQNLREQYPEETHFKAALFAYVFFELSNANQDKELIDLSNTSDTIENLTEQKERIEHQSTLKTHEYVQRLLREGEFSFHIDLPYLRVFKDFSLHYHFQILSGHTDAVVKQYSEIMQITTIAFRELWKNPIEADEKDALTQFMQLIYLKVEGDEAQKGYADTEIKGYLTELKEKEDPLSERILMHILSEFGSYLPAITYN